MYRSCFFVLMTIIDSGLFVQFKNFEKHQKKHQCCLCFYLNPNCELCVTSLCWNYKKKTKILETIKLAGFFCLLIQ